MCYHQVVRIAEFVRPDNTTPFQQWFNSLHSQAASKVSIALVRLELGNTSNLKRIGMLSECRVDWGPGYRIYLYEDGRDLIILFGGGTKQRQHKDIAQAERLLEEYLALKSKLRGNPK